MFDVDVKNVMEEKKKGRRRRNTTQVWGSDVPFVLRRLQNYKTFLVRTTISNIHFGKY